ncbi:rho guanine nucleotide exchange factor 3 [Aplysia californica]|uniref:Rho guanine nucleotide exchange factor 3 n=1 Tax=Aplysia californica TaxID=6500 RepID=A0ABM1A9Y9_APLCA|nr:rho guanine nucleotide exchange factor 3 [Aplysia californica]
MRGILLFREKRRVMAVGDGAAADREVARLVSQCDFYVDLNPKKRRSSHHGGEGCCGGGGIGVGVGEVVEVSSPEEDVENQEVVEEGSGGHTTCGGAGGHRGLRVRFLSMRQKKSKRSLLRVSASLANLISPSRGRNVNLSSRLQELRRPDGTTHQIGSQVRDWSKSLRVYVEYCANQIKAKAIFDEKKNEPAIDDFFQRCLASPFSRKLDLWTLLDGARGRFVKYPLLVRSIQKYTPSDSDDSIHLEKSVHQLEEIIKEADHKTGQAKCEHSKSSLHYLFDDQKVAQIQESSALLCSGCMKNNKSTKLYVFLFDKVVVISRSTNQSGRQMYQVYRQPIPTSELLVEDLPDGEVKIGSFRNAFGQGSQTAKNLIRLSFVESDKGQSHTLIANDEHDKRQWMQAFAKVTNNIVVLPESKSKEKQQQLSSTSNSS